jgi:NAD(P)-dependent dehydrogenase (short-subunit alcohol dehydrogenase family)
MPSLKDKTVLIIGRGSGIARAIAVAASRVEPGGSFGTADDIAAVALAVLTNGFLTGASIPVDGGEHLI